MVFSIPTFAHNSTRRVLPGDSKKSLDCVMSTSKTASSLIKFWNHPAGKIKYFKNIYKYSPYNMLIGPKTVHFWAPMFKWGLVIAGLADMNRPVEKVSLFQSAGKYKR